MTGGACLVAWAMRRQRQRSFWPYILIPGTMSWSGLYLGGLHPALALVPILPFLPHARRDPGLFVEAAAPQHDALNEFEHRWETPVEFILFMFALTNAGVPVSGGGVPTWIVLAALVAGKPSGILAATWVAERAGFCRSPGLDWGSVAVLGITAGIGFTVALFFTTAAFAPGPTLDQAKLGALLSISAGLIAIVAGRLLNLRPAVTGSDGGRPAARAN